MSCYLSKLLVQTLVFSSAIASADAARPFLTPRNPFHQQALKVRGGWTGVDTAKAVTKVGLVVGTATSLSAKTVADKSSIENIDPISLLLIRRIGVVILSFSIASYLLLFQDASAFTAVGISCLGTIIELSKTVFDGTPKDLGFASGGQVLVLFVSTIFSFLLLNDSPLSKDIVLKIHSGWLVLNGLFMGCFPKIACTLWGDVDATSLSVLQYFVSLWGFGILSLGALSGCLATGMATDKALALGAIPLFARFIMSKFI